MTRLQGKSSTAAAAFLVCAIIALGNAWPVADGFTTGAIARQSAEMQTLDRGFPLYGSTLTAPTKEETISTNNGPPPSSPGNRRAQNKQFLLKKWKKQSAKKATAERMEKDSQSKLVSVVGMSVASIKDKAKAKAISKPTKQSAKLPAEKPKIWNTKVNKSAVNPNKATPKSSNKIRATPKSSSDNGLLPWTALIPGSTVSGKVVKVLPYGVLVQTSYDIPGKTPGCALLHNQHFMDADDEESSITTESSSITKKQPLPVGSEVVNARVIHLNRDKGTLHISLRPPDQQRIAKRPVLQVGDHVQGKVVRLQPYGAFVDVGHKRNALLHISRMSMYKVNKITDQVRVGQTVSVRVLRMTDKDLAVSMLSKENDAFVDRRELQAKRMALWQQVVTAADGKDLERAKKELLEVDRIIWDQFMANESGAPRSVEV
jgi:predicted RNA-binding protein with RPS1 domain